MQQRGLKKQEIDLVLRFADREVRKGGTVVALSLSRNQISDLQADGIINAAHNELLRNLVVLYSSDDQEVVTAFRGGTRKGLRTYGRPTPQKRQRSQAA
jgi:hypothetical protein|tara:strand:- start:705 stop:1001 length:297 start_codon:yes stop_codon:yes gene_type:complete